MHPWPPFDLVLRPLDDVEPAIELRIPTDDELLALIDVARAGVHAPNELPFGRPWTSHDSPRMELEFLQWHWGKRASIEPESWDLFLAVFVGGQPIGTQTIDATRFPTRRLVSTGSWYGSAWQGRGIGTRARVCVLDLAFTHLGAVAAETGAWNDNVASQRVAEKLGYEPNGTGTWPRAGAPMDAQRFRMTAERWREVRPFDVEVSGLERCLPMLLGDAAPHAKA
jgi:RimJ/RimL family protein N-acetyltransferase